MISFAVKIVLQVLLESSVTTRFPTTSDPAGDGSDWTGHSDCLVNAQVRRGTDGHVLVPVVVLMLDPVFTTTFNLSRASKLDQGLGGSSV